VVAGWQRQSARHHRPPTLDVHLEVESPVQPIVVEWSRLTCQGDSEAGSIWLVPHRESRRAAEVDTAGWLLGTDDEFLHRTA
jgi:hypothetical protein